MVTFEGYNRIVLNQNNYEKVSGGIKRLVTRINTLSENEIFRAEPLEDLLLDQEFMLDVYSEAKELDTEARDTIVRNNPPKHNISPYIYYDIYLTEQSFIENLPESSHKFYTRDDYDFDQFPYPFQYCIFDEGKEKMNELCEAYNEDSYTDLKAIQKDLKKDLEKHNLRFYIEILARIKTMLNSSDKTTEDLVEIFSSLLLWLYGGSGLGFDLMYLIDSSMIKNASNNELSNAFDSFNRYRLSGSIIYFRIYLIDYLLEMKKKKFSGNQVGINYFLEDYNDKKDDHQINLSTDALRRFIHNIATAIDEDGRSKYKYHHVKAYLETFHYDKSLRSVKSRRNEAVKKLKGEEKSYELLKNAANNVLGNGTKSSPGWQRKLKEAIGEEV